MATSTISQDDALIFGLNPADSTLGGGDNPSGASDTEDPTGGRLSHDLHHHSGSRFDVPRRNEQPREAISPTQLLSPQESKRVPLTQLTARSRMRDRDLYRRGK